MDRGWISVASTTTGSVIDPLCASCHQGYIPDSICIIGNPTLRDELENQSQLASSIVEKYRASPEIETKNITDETSFEEIYNCFGEYIDDARKEDSEIAVNFTPGRKYMAAIAFWIALESNVDHLYYIYMKQRHFDRAYPEIPRTAVELIDFREEI